MKHMKKAFALILVLTIVMSLGIPPYAATETGTITINNAAPGVKYSVYRIFDLESHSKGDEYSYKVRKDNGWDQFAISIAYSKDTNPAGLITFSNDYITPIYNGKPLQSCDEAKWTEALIAKAKDWIKVQGTQFDKQGSNAAEGSPVDNTVVKITDLPAGYYFVDTTLGTVCSLDTVINPEVVINEKNEPPTVDKKVFDDDAHSERSDASIGDLVKFTATIHVKDGAVGYELLDTMTQGLVFENDTHPLTVAVDGKDIPSDHNWELKGKSNDTSFNIIFADAFVADLVGKDIVVTYYGKLTSEAVKYDVANNRATVKYGEDAETKYESIPSETDTYHYVLKVLKYTEKAGEKIALDGAHFKLSKSDSLDPVHQDDIIQLSGSGAEYIVDPAGTVDTIITDKDGVFTIKGLDAGTYYLHEIKSPDGYNKLAAPIKIVIDHNGVVKYSDNSAVTDDTFEVTQSTGSKNIVSGAVPVLNQSGNKLPSTGGIGTTIFYTVGSIMMLSALVLLITKKKLSVK